MVKLGQKQSLVVDSELICFEIPGFEVERQLVFLK